VTDMSKSPFTALLILKPKFGCLLKILICKLLIQETVDVSHQIQRESSQHTATSTQSRWVLMEEEILNKLDELSVRYHWERLFFSAEPVSIVESPKKSTRVIRTPSRGKSVIGTPQTSSSFKRNREILTAKYYKEYNRIGFQDQLPKDLLIIWNKRMTKSAGFTKMKKYNFSDTPRTATIELSTKVVAFSHHSLTSLGS
jgi:hypothetical protein